MLTLCLPSAIIAKTQVSEVRYETDLDDVLADFGPTGVHVTDADVVDAFPELDKYSPTSARLLSYVFAERQIKSEAELEVLRYSALVSSKAHESIMKVRLLPFLRLSALTVLLSSVVACWLE